MEWEIIIHQEPRYLEVITRGKADKDGSLQMARAITENMRKHKTTKALIDHRKIESVEGKTIDIYDRPRKFRLIGAILGIQIAEIIKPEHIEHFRFFETVCLNQGYKFSIFQDEEPAKKWLLG